jgi:methionyl aminopeptidase
MKRSKKKARSGRREGATRLLSAEQQQGMRAAGRLAGEILDSLTDRIQPGTTTAEIDRIVDEMTRARGATSAPFGYRGHGAPPFPGHCCTSVNDVVCHGIPSPSHTLRDGDIVNVDVTPILDGWHGDSSRTFVVGEASPKARRLVVDTRYALWLGIRAVKPGGRTGDIGDAIQHFAEELGYSVVREFTGHGIGRIFHTAPSILHYGKPNTGDLLHPGMTFTIEPMINLGHWRTQILEDGWTAVTVDGSLSAQFEHTVLVTETGVDVLTLGKDEQPPL